MDGLGPVAGYTGVAVVSGIIASERHVIRELDVHPRAHHGIADTQIARRRTDLVGIGQVERGVLTGMEDIGIELPARDLVPVDVQITGAVILHPAADIPRETA